MSADRLRETRRDAHREAASLAVINLAALLGLAALSRKNDWELLGAQLWWLWLVVATPVVALDRKSTRLNSSHPSISYAVFCLKKKKKYEQCVLYGVVHE